MLKNESIIEAIEDRLKQLEREKAEIEKLYGIDENVVKELKNAPNTIKINSENFIGNDSLKNYSPYLSKSSLNSQNLNHNMANNPYNDVNLPKLELTVKKEYKTIYKTPEALKDSLKYEPNIKDLLDKNDFEPSFTNFNNLKTSPFIPKGNNLTNYLKLNYEEFLRNI